MSEQKATNHCQDCGATIGAEANVCWDCWIEWENSHD